jgi:hypothetical protein
MTIRSVVLMGLSLMGRPAPHWRKLVDQSAAVRPSCDRCRGKDPSASVRLPGNTDPFALRAD